LPLYASISRFNSVLDQANQIPMLPNYKPMVQILWSLLIFQCFQETWLITLITFEWLKTFHVSRGHLTQLECSQWIDTLSTLVWHKQLGHLKFWFWLSKKMICSSLLHVLNSFMDMVPIMLGDWLVIWLCAFPKNAYFK
jgi:hypothetical protein